MKNCTVVDHPLLRHKLTVLRNEKTLPVEFRALLDEITTFLAYEATRDLKTRKVRCQTPLEATRAEVIAEPVFVVSIMRAGNGMLPAMMRILPFAQIGHIGIYRDKFIDSTVEYYFRIPKGIRGKRIWLLDPLLATGDTVVAAVNRLKDYEPASIQVLSILAAPEGLKKLYAAHPEVEVLCVSIERELNKKGYILPGLGDAGDRIYGTL
jgi:uracil phosphoribosyltransferase